MPNDQPPAGYHDASAQAGGPPPGYHDASAGAMAASPQAGPPVTPETGKQAPYPQPEYSALGGPAGGAAGVAVRQGDNLKGMFDALAGRLPDQAHLRDGNSWDFLKDLDQRFIEGPYKQDLAEAGQSHGVEKVGHNVAAGLDYLLPGVGRMATQAGGALGGGDPWGMIDAALAVKGGTMGPEAQEHVSSAVRNLERHATLNKGEIGIVNTNVKTPLTLLDHAVNNEIGKHANAVIDKDQLDMQMKNNPAGFVNAQAAAQAARDYMGKTFKPVDNTAENLITRAETGPLHMREAKAMTTQVGGMAQALGRQGRLAEAGALNKLYDGLHEATQTRADQLGMGKNWSHYIDETSSYKKMQDGLLGEIQSEPVHAKVLDKLTDPKRAGEVSEIADKLKQYNIDPSSFQQAQKMAANIKDLSYVNKNLFMGKIRALYRHPLKAGIPMSIGAVVGAHTGVPMMSLIMPLLIAGKVSGMLDKADLSALLRDAQKTIPQGFDRAYPTGSGPMPVQPPPPSGGPPPAGAAPAGGGSPPPAAPGAPSPQPNIPSEPRPAAGDASDPIGDARLLAHPTVQSKIGDLLAAQAARKHMSATVDRTMSMGANPKGVASKDVADVPEPPKTKEGPPAGAPATRSAKASAVSDSLTERLSQRFLKAGGDQAELDRLKAKVDPTALNGVLQNYIQSMKGSK